MPDRYTNEAQRHHEQEADDDDGDDDGECEPTPVPPLEAMRDVSGVVVLVAAMAGTPVRLTDEQAGDLHDALGTLLPDMQDEIAEWRSRYEAARQHADEAEEHNLDLIHELQRERALRAKAMRGCQRLRMQLAATRDE